MMDRRESLRAAVLLVLDRNSKGDATAVRHIAGYIFQFRGEETPTLQDFETMLEALVTVGMLNVEVVNGTRWYLRRQV